MKGLSPLILGERIIVPKGPRAQILGFLAPKYHSYHSIWSLIPHYLSHWTLREYLALQTPLSYRRLMGTRADLYNDYIGNYTP